VGVLDLSLRCWVGAAVCCDVLFSG
jgi:hypothetical protein